MSGLEQIIESINNQGQSIAEKTTSAAKAQASEIITAANKSAGETKKGIVDAAKDQCERNLENAALGVQALTAKKLLAAKVDAVYEVITAASNRIRNLSDDVYFETMAVLVKKNVAADGGCIFFSKRDLARMPAGFQKTLNDRIGGKFSVTLSETPADIDDGFVIKFGDIEENCTVTALTEANSEALKDNIAQILFG